MKVNDEQYRAALSAYKAGIGFTLKTLKLVDSAPDIVLRHALKLMISQLQDAYDNAEDETNKWTQEFPDDLVERAEAAGVGELDEVAALEELQRILKMADMEDDEDDDDD